MKKDFEWPETKQYKEYNLIKEKSNKCEKSFWAKRYYELFKSLELKETKLKNDELEFVLHHIEVSSKIWDIFNKAFEFFKNNDYGRASETTLRVIRKLIKQ